MLYGVHTFSCRPGWIPNNPCSNQSTIINLSKSSSGSTSGSLIKTFSKSEEISENRWLKLYFISYFNLNTEIIIWPPMNFDLACFLGLSYKMGFWIWHVPCLTKNHYKTTCFLGLCYFIDVFSSPELKAQLSLSDHNLSAFHCPCCCKLFTFSSSSPELLGQFQTNLAQSILWWREFKFIQMKGPALFKEKIIT